MYPEELPALLESFAAEAELELLSPSPISLVAQEGEEDGEGGLLDTYYAVQGMLRTFKTYDERYVTYAEVQRGDVVLKLFNLDPSFCCSKWARATAARSSSRLRYRRFPFTET